MTAQLDMFGEAMPATISATADPARVRRKLEAMLAETRKGGVPVARRRLMETLVPQMVRWLPDDEAERMTFAFGEALATASHG